MIYSFDIFDTCLVRKCGSPQSVFELVADNAFSTHASANERHSFIVERKRAERETYGPSQTLSDIYSAFNLPLDGLLPKYELIKLEEDTERKMLTPVLSTLECVTSLRNKGHLIIFVSDMYLSSAFLKEVMTTFGFLKEDDKLFVSCECNATKADGELYKYIKDQLHLRNFRQWHHFGDNQYSDVKVPCKSGICAKRLIYGYTPYQRQMRSVTSLDYGYGDMLAGLGRSLRAQYKSDAHYDLYLDVVLPLFVPLVHRVLRNASETNIEKLYFCARDAYPLYCIAKQFHTLFPSVKIQYLYISRKSLYEGDEVNKIGYLRSIGLATESANNAIVDVCSSGHTLLALNSLLQKYKYEKVKGYFFEIANENPIQRIAMNTYCYAELDDCFISNSNTIMRKLPSNWFMYELFFPLNTQKRTIGYAGADNRYAPILEDEDKKEYQLDGLENYVNWRSEVMEKYVKGFLEMGLYKYSDGIFERYAIPQLAEFFHMPDKHYLPALAEFYVEKEDNVFVPYVDKSIIRLPMNVLNKRTMWKRGTIVYSIPTWLGKILLKDRL